MSVVAATQPHKTYALEDKKPFFKHFYPKDVAMLAVRSAAIQGMMVFNAYVASLDLEATDDDDESSDEEGRAAIVDKPAFVAPSLEEFCRACAKVFGKSLSVTTCVRSLEAISLRVCRPQIVSKLIKDISKSATRKYARTSSKLTAGVLMLKTGMRANLLSHLAVFLVEETYHVWILFHRCFVLKRKSNKNKLRSIEDGGVTSTTSEDEQDTDVPFLPTMGLNASRSLLAIVTGGIGAAMGTAVRPGVGTFIGGTLGDSIAYVLF
ncbi:hypothetical protein PsorP6_013188 [Peronosclerospora sorghi]|uniref:Uncharacterized protein n=1 Tax=Peronosclerospora sorghi TaxID=230839 RepID=A0ACC0WGY8_9STRA|nr:hypothetical protein PsorP6_013188 [Peronosclerospora sorghi]